MCLGLKQNSNDTPSERSLSISSVNKLQEALKRVKEANITIKLNNCDLFLGHDSRLDEIYETHIFDKQVTKPLTRFISKGDINKSMAKELDLTKLLRCSKEDEAQAVLNRYASALQAVDISRQTAYQFNLPQEVGDQLNAYPATAQHDLTSIIAPKHLEIKVSGESKAEGLTAGDIDLLTQVRHCSACITCAWPYRSLITGDGPHFCIALNKCVAFH